MTQTHRVMLKYYFFNSFLSKYDFYHRKFHSIWISNSYFADFSQGYNQPTFIYKLFRSRNSITRRSIRTSSPSLEPSSLVPWQSAKPPKDFQAQLEKTYEKNKKKEHGSRNLERAVRAYMCPPIVASAFWNTLDNRQRI